MVDVVGRAVIKVEGDVDSTSFEKSGKKIGGSLKKAAVLGVAALGGIAAAAIKGTLAAEEAAAVQAKLANVLGNMGKTGAVEAVDAYASSLSKVIGVDDEVIKGGQTILATFSNVAKSAGETGGAFERATLLAADLAAAGFGSIETNAVQLGKALQDPVKGVTALGRAGITFSEDQKAMIKSLVDTGDAAAAQDLILKEVEKQVGGTAEASVKESDRIKTALGELDEAFGRFLNPEGEKGSGIADALFELSEALDRVNENDSFTTWKTRFIADMEESRHGTFAFAKEFKTNFNGMDDVLKGWGTSIKTTLENVLDGITRQSGKWKNAGSGLIRALGDGLKANISLGDLWQGVKNALNRALRLPRTLPIPFGKDITIPAFAQGGVSAGGLALVGERGPELVNLPRGARVFSNQESRSVAGGDFNLTQIFNAPSTAAEAAQEINWALQHGSRFGALTNARGVGA